MIFARSADSPHTCGKRSVLLPRFLQLSKLRKRLGFRSRQQLDHVAHSRILPGIFRLIVFDQQPDIGDVVRLDRDDHDFVTTFPV